MCEKCDAIKAAIEGALPGSKVLTEKDAPRLARVMARSMKEHRTKSSGLAYFVSLIGMMHALCSAEMASTPQPREWTPGKEFLQVLNEALESCADMLDRMMDAPKGAPYTDEVYEEVRVLIEKLTAEAEFEACDKTEVFH